MALGAPGVLAGIQLPMQRMVTAVGQFCGRDASRSQSKHIFMRHRVRRRRARTPSQIAV